MAVARVACRAQVGLHAPLVHVEVSLASGLPVFCFCGPPGWWSTQDGPYAH